MYEVCEVMHEMHKFSVALCTCYVSASGCWEHGFHPDIFGGNFMICYTALRFLRSTSLWYPNPKDSLPPFPSYHLSYTMNQ